MIWLTADTHLGHENIITQANRPFRSVKQMDDHIISAINEMVAPGDELYVLGDFSFRTSREDVRMYRWLIGCRNVYLIRGNHDLLWHGSSPFQREYGYYDQLHSPRPRRHRIVMCHYPILSWRSMDFGSIHAHGHIHADAGYNRRNRDAGIFRYDVGVEANGYAPVSLDYLTRFFDGVEPRRAHHTDEERSTW